MMISAHCQKLCMGSPGISQPGLCRKSCVLLSASSRRGGLNWSSSFQKSRGCSTLAIKQASSFSCSAEDASDDEVPAKNTGVRDRTGAKTLELVDLISPPQPASTVDDQFPPLLSMIIDGFPPLQQSGFVHEAEKRLLQYVDRYPNVSSLSEYCRQGLSAASYANPGAVSLDRIVVLSLVYALLFVVDDLFFDTQDEFLFDQYGISRDACASPENIQEYLYHLHAVLSQQVQPRNSAPLLETMMWELGRDALELSNPEWFKTFADYVMVFIGASVASEADIVQGHNLCFQNVESYTAMRASNVAGKLTQLMVEFAIESYIPGALRATPYFENLTKAGAIHIGLVNDVFSYHKESAFEQNPRNLITVLMECEGKPLVQTVHTAIGLVNTYGREVVDLEAEAWNSTLQNYLHGLKACLAGNAYFCFADKRYHHPDSVIPELRDTTISWKIVPHVKGTIYREL